MRTTIELEDRIYKKIVKEYGKRRISEAINKILSKHYKKVDRSFFGVDPWLKHTDLSDLRDEHDRNL
jgi:hypothetical protein